VPKPMQSAVENDQCVPDQFDARDMLEFAWPLSTSAQDEAERAVRREDAHVPSLGITHYGLRCGSDRHLRGPFEQLLGIVSGADGARVGRPFTGRQPSDISRAKLGVRQPDLSLAEAGFARVKCP